MTDRFNQDCNEHQNSLELKIEHEERREEVIESLGIEVISRLLNLPENTPEEYKKEAYDAFMNYDKGTIGSIHYSLAANVIREMME